jgi:hypothetical protein
LDVSKECRPGDPKHVSKYFSQIELANAQSDEYWDGIGDEDLLEITSSPGTIKPLNLLQSSPRIVPCNHKCKDKKKYTLIE